MKDFFCLMNTLMNRSKADDKPGGKAGANTPSSSAAGGGNRLAVPFEASEDVRVLPGADPRKAKTALLSVLEPFLPLLPDLSGVELSDQKVLHNCLYSAGVTAALSLQKNGASATSALLNIDRESAEWKELFNSLGKTLDFDDSIDTYRKLSQKLAIPEELRSDTNGQLMKMITNEVAAFALTAFASMIYRRPFTKQMEVIMAPTQEADAVSTDDENGGVGPVGADLSRSLREQSLGGHSSAAGHHNHHHSLPPDVSAGGGGGKAVSPACGAKPVRKPTDGYASPPAGGEEPHSNASSVAAFASTDGTEECDNEDECDCHADDDEYINEYIGDEDCLFRYVCSIGYEDLARQLMLLRRSTEFSHWSDSTPLMEACCGGYAGVVRALIEGGANVNAQSSTKNTALTYACAAQHVECAKEVLKSGKCDINLRNDSGHCALMEAASTGNVELLKLLIEHGATPLSVIDNHDFKESALTLASYKGHLEAVKYLISIFPQNIDEKNRDEEFHTALMEASMDGHVEVARALLEAGAKTNLSSESFESPLTLAACGGHVELVSLLLSFGARLEDVNDEGYTPLMEACREGHRDVVELLVDHGANVNLKVDGASETPLSLAASGGYLNIVELLVERGGDLTQGGPLYETLQEGHTDVACYIIQQLREKVFMEEVQHDFNNSLMSAAELDNVIVCNALLSNNADPNCFSSEGRTPLMEAAKQGNMHIVDLLVKNNANVNLVSPNGEWTALSLACANGHDDIVRYLLEHGADPRQKLGDSSSCLLEATKSGHINCVEVLLDYKIPSASRLASHIFDKSAKVKKHIHQNAASVRPKPKGIVPPKDGTAKSESSQTTVGASVTKSTGTSTADNIYTDDEYTNVFAAIFQQQEQFIQQHLAQNSKAGAGKSTQTAGGTAAGGTTPNANASQLFRALATAAASSPKYNGTDDYLFAQFVQRSLITTKKREAMTEDELNAFTEMIQQQFRTIFPSGQMDAAALMANAQMQAQDSGVDAAKTKPLIGCLETDIKEGRMPKSFVNTAKQCAGHHTNYRSPNPMAPPSVSAGSRNRTRTPSPSTVSSRGGARSTTPNGAPPPLCACCNAAATRSTDGSGEDATTFSVSSTSNTTQNSQPPCDLALLDTQIEPNADTALTVACVAGNVDIASMLIHRGFDIEHRDKKGFTPLILCATGGHVAICRLLLEAGCQVDAQADRTKDTALSLACSGGRKEIVELLLLFGANKEHRNISDYTPLSLAASGGYVDIIQILLNHGAEINSRTGSKLGISPLMLAAMNGHEAATRLLLDNGSDINAQIETNRNTALTLACFQGRTEVVRLLLNNGANIDHRAKSLSLKKKPDLSKASRGVSLQTGLTPLMEAANGGYVEVGALLLSAGADPNAAPVITSRDTALTIAADKGHAAFVELIIRSNANVNARNKKGSSALWLACCGGHLETVRTLIRNGADSDAQDNRKVSPLMIAFRKGHVTIVEFIVDYVTQFPSDQECDRYILTLTDQELINKCTKCFDFISRAKSKQAEQANKAAQSLLDMIAQEEAMAESKKRTKQRQKAKKKAKKNAAKLPSQVDDEDQEENEDEEDLKRVDEHTITDEFQTVHEDLSSLRINDDDSSKAEASHNAAAEEMRVPCLNPIHESPETTSSSKPSVTDKPELEFLSPTATNPLSSNGSRGSSSRKATTGAQKTARRVARRARGGGGNAAQSTDAKSANAAVKSTDATAKNNGDETDSWVNPNKRRATTTKIVKPSSRSATSHSVTHAKPAATIDAMVPIDEWIADVSVTNTKRKSSQTLSVSSQSIARVIGRSGSNINAIREATNAHIEVEKMTTKREQATRLITIKGTSEAIRNSVTMIEMLIKEQDLHINDILRRVVGTAAAVAATQQDTNTLIDVPPPPQRVEQHAVALANAPAGYPNVQVDFAGNVTNVWQQRAAIREQQKEHETDKPKVVASPAPTTYGGGVIAPSVHDIPITPPVVDMPLPIVAKPTVAIGDEIQQQRPLLSQERKAPGYERPNSVANVGQSAALNAPVSVVPQLHQSAAVGFTASSNATETTLFEDVGLNDKDLPDFDKLLSGAGGSVEKVHPSISDIWNNCGAELPSPPTDLADIFGNDILDSKTWLPSSTDIAAADRRAANAQRYDSNFSTFNGPNNASDWLGGIFPALGSGVASTMASASSPSAVMKSMLAEIGDSGVSAASSSGADNVQSSSKAHFSNAPNTSRWDFAEGNSSSTWNATEDIAKATSSDMWDLSAPANSPLPFIPKNFQSSYDPIRFSVPRGSAQQMPLFASDPQQPPQQQPHRSSGSVGSSAYSSQFQPKFSANAGVRGAAYSSMPLATQKPTTFMSGANPLYQTYVQGPLQQQQQQLSQQLAQQRHYRRENVNATTSANGSAYGMPFSHQQQQFFQQPQQQHFPSANGPSSYSHQMMGQQPGMTAKNQIFNGSGNSGFVHPPPGFIRQQTTGAFYSGQPAVGTDNGAKPPTAGSNVVPTTAQRNYYNFY